LWCLFGDSYVKIDDSKNPGHIVNQPCFQVPGECKYATADGKICDKPIHDYSLVCIANGISGKCVNDTCRNLPIELNESDPHKMGWELYGSNFKDIPFDKFNITTISTEDRIRLTPIIKKLTYWKNPQVSVENLPIIPGRYLSTRIHYSGFNNRRMSLETAYALAFVTNRTLILQPPHCLVPFRELGYEERYWDIYGMKSGWPTLTYDEFKELPNYDHLSTKMVKLKWEAVPESIFVIPSLPGKESEEYQVDYTNWRKPRSPDIGWGHMYQESDHHDAEHIYIEADLFVQFYVFHYPTRSSGITNDMILRLVRDHLHFRPEVMEWAAKVLDEMPECFSTIHYRRGDLNYPSAKISPRRVFQNTFNLFHQDEYIYVATDDNPENFKKSFIQIFEKRYKIKTLQDYKHIFSQIDEKWVPLVELIICTQGRAFVGTSYVQCMIRIVRWFIGGF